MSFAEKYPMPGQFEYKGKLFFGGEPLNLTSPQRLQKLHEDFEIREDDVMVASFPRSGTHWTAEIVSWILFHEEEEQRLNEESHPDRTPYIDFTPPECDVTLEAYENFPRETPRVFISHLSADLAPKQCETKGKVIYVMRNPKDAAVSMFHLYRITKVLGPYEGPWEDFLEAYMNGSVMWGDYFDHILSWWARRQNKNLLIVRYEEMRRNPHQAVKTIAEFLGKSLTEEHVEKIVLNTCFEAMKKNPMTNLSLGRFNFIFVEKEPGVEFVRKGGVGGWKDNFTVSQSEKFDELIQRRLQGTEIVYEYVE